MSSISAGAPVIAEGISAYYNPSKTSKKTEEKKEDIAVTKKEEAEAAKKTSVSGRTIGNPELTEKAAKYYEELKKKYGNLDFILVSKDQKILPKQLRQNILIRIKWWCLSTKKKLSAWQRMRSIARSMKELLQKVQAV